jgi:hypothetical protein
MKLQYPMAYSEDYNVRGCYWGCMSPKVAMAVDLYIRSSMVYMEAHLHLKAAVDLYFGVYHFCQQIFFFFYEVSGGHNTLADAGECIPLDVHRNGYKAPSRSYDILRRLHGTAEWLLNVC